MRPVSYTHLDVYKRQVNKILIPMINEAIGLVETGVASVADIDKAMQLGANHPMRCV